MAAGKKMVPLLTRSKLLRNRYVGQIVSPLWIIALALILAFCFFASSICITLLLASFLAIILDPLITSLERLHISRMISAAVAILLGTVLVVVLAYIGYKHALDIVDDMPQYAQRVGSAIAPFTKRVQKVQDSAGKLNAEAQIRRVPEVKLQSQFPEWTTYVIRGVGPVSGIVIIIGVVPFLMFFLLIQKRSLKRKLTLLWGDKIDVPALIRNATLMIRAFLLGNLLIGTAMALATSAILYFFKIQGAGLLGAVSGFLNLIPFVGAILGAAIPVAAAVFQYQPPSTYIGIFAVVVSLHVISANLLIPKIIGKRVSISPVAATIGILFWGWLWGVIGALLAVPLTALVKIIADTHSSLGKLGNVLAEQPEPTSARPDADRIYTDLVQNPGEPRNVAVK
jgi:predicted PurR-regulated permease PerM